MLPDWSCRSVYICRYIIHEMLLNIAIFLWLCRSTKCSRMGCVTGSNYRPISEPTLVFFFPACFVFQLATKQLNESIYLLQHLCKRLCQPFSYNAYHGRHPWVQLITFQLSLSWIDIYWWVEKQSTSPFCYRVPFARGFILKKCEPQCVVTNNQRTAEELVMTPLELWL